jgi:hypothetical protein
MRTKEYLYLTEDRKRVVNENAREGRFLFANPGDEIPDIEARRYGLIKTEPEAVKVVPEKIEPEKAVDAKMDEPAEDKMAETPANKTRKRKSGFSINMEENNG